MNDQERIDELYRQNLILGSQFLALLAAIEKTSPELDKMYKKLSKDLEHRLGKPGTNQEN